MPGFIGQFCSKEQIEHVQSRVLATPLNDLTEVRDIVATLLCINRDLLAKLEIIETKVNRV
jgi:hypothetical protein